MECETESGNKEILKSKTKATYFLIHLSFSGLDWYDAPTFDTIYTNHIWRIRGMYA